LGSPTFESDPGLTGVGATGASQNAAARVTVQQQVTRNLTVTYVSNVGSTQQQVIQVEYNVNRNVSIVALRDYNGTFGIDVKNQETLSVDGPGLQFGFASPAGCLSSSLPVNSGKSVFNSSIVSWAAFLPKAKPTSCDRESLRQHLEHALSERRTVIVQQTLQVFSG